MIGPPSEAPYWMRVSRRLLVALPADELVGLDQAVVLIGDEHLAVEIIGARAGDRGDDRGAGILIFRLEVGGEDAELGHRQLREGIAAADVLADDAALVDVAAKADAVDEHVDLGSAGAVAVAIGADAAAAEGLA